MRASWRLPAPIAAASRLPPAWPTTARRCAERAAKGARLRKSGLAETASSQNPGSPPSWKTATAANRTERADGDDEQDKGRLPQIVIPGLDPGIYVDGRVKPGHDE